MLKNKLFHVPSCVFRHVHTPAEHTCLITCYRNIELWILIYENVTEICQATTMLLEITQHNTTQHNTTQHNTLPNNTHTHTYYVYLHHNMLYNYHIKQCFKINVQFLHFNKQSTTVPKTLSTWCLTGCSNTVTTSTSRYVLTSAMFIQWHTNLMLCVVRSLPYLQVLCKNSHAYQPKW
jgi:hypothetical protein